MTMRAIEINGRTELIYQPRKRQHPALKLLYTLTIAGPAWGYFLRLVWMTGP